MFIDEIIRICLTSDTQAPIWGTTPITRAADVVVNPVQPLKQASGPLGRETSCKPNYTSKALSFSRIL